MASLRDISREQAFGARIWNPVGGGAAAEVCCLGRWVSAKEREGSGFLSECRRVLSDSSGQKKNKPASPLKAVSVGRGGDGQPSAVSGGGERLLCSGGNRAPYPRWSLPAPHRQGEGTSSSAGGSSPPAPSWELRGPASGSARPTCPRLKFPSLESRWSYFTGILLFWKMFHRLWHIVSASSLSPQVVAVLTKIYWLGIVTRCLSNSPLLTAQPLATRD